MKSEDSKGNWRSHHKALLLEGWTEAKPLTQERRLIPIRLISYQNILIPQPHRGPRTYFLFESSQSKFDYPAEFCWNDPGPNRSRGTLKIPPKKHYLESVFTFNPICYFKPGTMSPEMSNSTTCWDPITARRPHSLSASRWGASSSELVWAAASTVAEIDTDRSWKVVNQQKKHPTHATGQEREGEFEIGRWSRRKCILYISKCFSTSGLLHF